MYGIPEHVQSPGAAQHNTSRKLRRDCMEAETGRGRGGKGSVHAGGRRGGGAIETAGENGTLAPAAVANGVADGPPRKSRGPVPLGRGRGRGGGGGRGAPASAAGLQVNAASGSAAQESTPGCATDELRVRAAASEHSTRAQNTTDAPLPCACRVRSSVPSARPSLTRVLCAPPVRRPSSASAACSTVLSCPTVARHRPTRTQSRQKRTTPAVAGRERHRPRALATPPCRTNRARRRVRAYESREYQPSRNPFQIARHRRRLAPRAGRHSRQRCWRRTRARWRQRVRLRMGTPGHPWPPRAAYLSAAPRREAVSRRRREATGGARARASTAQEAARAAAARAAVAGAARAPIGAAGPPSTRARLPRAWPTRRRTHGAPARRERPS